MASAIPANVYAPALSVFHFRLIQRQIPAVGRSRLLTFSDKNATMKKRPRLDSRYCERLTSDTTVEVLIDKTDSSGRMLYFGLTLRGEVSPDVQCRVLISPVLHSAVFPTRLSQILLESLESDVKAGGIYGFPLTSCCLTVNSVDYCEKRSTEMAVRLAASKGIEQFLLRATLLIDNLQSENPH